ncbi:MAG: CPBP family intramembrane metalloprotease [Bacteroidetes bacterium]|jgi:uncharacterized protein|nr:CPBP family intramembrane metalloprotease [Bacteroidota bacterium]MBT6685732.1 CPBP family intramembrane metalloprotease [Bacteroidota bacterium]MBT7143028.1 CPBP family intramembrane metalloprotease [Bacteroidota bacterium]MBT7493441.1 CPBP family intramembrane metalloprotease [Bacteroidota bacterium]
MTENNEIQYPNIKQSWGIVGIAILSMILFSPVILLDNLIGEEISFLAYYLLAMGVPFLIVHRIKKKRTGLSNYNFDFSSVKIIMLVFIAIIAIQIGIISPFVNLIPMPEFMEKIFLELANQNGVFSFIAIVIAAPVLEELIFRGIILDGLLKKYSPVKSIIISSLLFGIVHLNPWQFLGAFIFGIFSGWIYYRTNKLILTIIMHFANNFLAFVAIYFFDEETMMDKSLTEIYGGLLNLSLISVGAIIITIICIYLLKNEFNKNEKCNYQQPSFNS